MATAENGRMHPDELTIDVSLVRRLLAEQQPDLADETIEHVDSTGTVNAMYRVGPDLVVRLPLSPSGSASVLREHRWLPFLAERLAVAVPVPVLAGKPTDYYPLPWSIFGWFDGVDGTAANFDPRRTAVELAAFIGSLAAIDPAGGPVPRPAAYDRGVPLIERDDYTRQAIDDARHLIDAGAVTAAWDRALAADPWTGPGVWLHGDIASGNLLFSDGVLTAVIDFGAMAIGDPACDLLVAWELFDADARQVFRSELTVDDHAWERGAGWALSTAIVALPYYEHSNRFMADQARSKLAAILDRDD